MGGIIASVVLATSVMFGGWGGHTPPRPFCPKPIVFRAPVCKLVPSGQYLNLVCSIQTIRIQLPCFSR